MFDINESQKIKEEQDRAYGDSLRADQLKDKQKSSEILEKILEKILKDEVFATNIM